MQELFRNYEEFEKEYPEEAKMLLEDVGKGMWMKYNITLYPSLIDFAEYELYEGWYAGFDFDQNYNGAPNPMEYIDMKAFSKALVRNWDETLHWENGDVVISTCYGW